MPLVVVGIGSNQQREQHVCIAVQGLARHFSEVTISSVYETEAVGFHGDPFYNLVASFNTSLDLGALLDAVHSIEEDCGRVRGEKRFGPRNMDIDILTYGDEICDGEPLEIPRSDIVTDAYVLVPLAELLPTSQHPELGESYAALLSRLRLDASGVRRIDFNPMAVCGLPVNRQPPILKAYDEVL